MSFKGLPESILELRGVDVSPHQVSIPYYLETGELHNRKILTPGSDGGWNQRYEESGKPLVPYGLDGLSFPSVAKERALFVTEGESDALALLATGSYDQCDVIGLPGSNSWKSEWAEILLRYQTVYLLADGDDAGQKMIEKVQLDVPSALAVAIPAGRDVRDIVQGSGGLGLLERLLYEADEAALQPELEAESEPNSWEPINLAVLAERPASEPTLGQIEGVIGFVYPGKRHVFSGPQESAKTLVAYAIGIQVIRAGGTLALIDFEMGAYEARNRFRELGATPSELGSLLYLEPETPATEEHVNDLILLAPQLVIVDAAAGAYDLQGLDDNSRQDAERFQRLFVRDFWKAGIATIVLDHVVKSADNRGKYAIGSERKVGGADVHLGFEVISPLSRGHAGLYKIITHKDRAGYLKRGTLAELHLTSAPETHAITCVFSPVAEIPEGEAWMPTRIMERLSILLELKSEPVSRRLILDEAGGREETGRKAIEALTRLGYVRETAGAHGARLVESFRAFRAEGPS